MYVLEDMRKRGYGRIINKSTTSLPTTNDRIKTWGGGPTLGFNEGQQYYLQRCLPRLCTPLVEAQIEAIAKESNLTLEEASQTLLREKFRVKHLSLLNNLEDCVPSYVQIMQSNSLGKISRWMVVGQVFRN